MEQTNSIGTLLRSQRELKNISIQEVSQKTKININILKSLENDDLNKLPNKTYVKGFVKNYAKTIGLDINDASDMLENTYCAQLGTIKEVEEKTQINQIQDTPVEENESEEIKETIISIIQGFLNKKIIYSIVGLVIAALIVKGIVNFFSQISFETQKLASEPQIKAEDENLFESQKTAELREEMSTEAQADTATITENESQSNEVELPENETAKTAPQEVAATSKVDDTKEEAEKVEEEKETKVVNIPAGKFPFKKFYPAPRNMFSIVENAPEANDTNLLPTHIKNLKLENQQAVYIAAVDGDTWISYKEGNENIKRYILKQGKHVLLKGETILLFMGNINVTKIFLNGKLIETDSRTGVKSLIFPEEKASDFELPLFPSYKGIPYAASEYKENMLEENFTPQEAN